MNREAQRKHRANMANMWTKYRLTEDEYRNHMDRQRGACKICGADFGETHKRACVDHDHYTGQIRGLLCTQCNTRIGWLEANIFKLLPYLQNAGS